MQPADLHAQSFRLEPIAFAGIARHVGEIPRDLFARPVAVGFAVTPLEIGDHAFERPARVIGAQAVVIGKADLGIARTVKDRVLRLLRQVLPFGVQRETVMFAERLQRLQVIGRTRFRPRRNCAAAQRAFLVGDDQIGIDVLLDAEPAAFWASAKWIVEREQSRLDFGNGEAGNRAGEFLREDKAARIGSRCRCELGLSFLPSPERGGSARNAGEGLASGNATPTRTFSFDPLGPPFRGRERWTECRPPAPLPPNRRRA